MQIHVFFVETDDDRSVCILPVRLRFLYSLALYAPRVDSGTISVSRHNTNDETKQRWRTLCNNVCIILRAVNGLAREQSRVRLFFYPYHYLYQVVQINPSRRQDSRKERWHAEQATSLTIYKHGIVLSNRTQQIYRCRVFNRPPTRLPPTDTPHG